MRRKETGSASYAGVVLEEVADADYGGIVGVC